MHKNESHPPPIIELPCIVRQKLCRTTSSLLDSRNQPDLVKCTKKRNKGRSILSAGERPRNGGPGLISVSLPEHTLRVALENVSKALSSGKEGGEDSDEEQSSNGAKQKGVKNNHSSGQNPMKLDEMFEKAKSLLPAPSLNCRFVQDESEEVESAEVLGKKAWTISSFCYECGRTSGVHLVKCPGCKGVSYCSRTCRSDNWKKGHQRECTGAQVKMQDAGLGKGRGVALHRTKILKRTNSSMI